MDTTIIVSIIAVVGVVLGGGVLFLRGRSAKKEPEVLYFRCPGCGRKLKYTSKQIGNKGACSSCKEPLTFPPPGMKAERRASQ